MITSTIEICGDFADSGVKHGEYVTLVFSPQSAPLRQRWRNNGLSADFLGDFVTTFFPGEENAQGTVRKQAEIRSAVCYVANELLENAMKFHERGVDFPVEINVVLNTDSVRLELVNATSPQRAEEYRQWVSKCAGGDSAEMLVACMEANAASDVKVNSGLGLLTILNDYRAKFGWKFELLCEPEALTSVTTQVVLAL